MKRWRSWARSRRRATGRNGGDPVPAFLLGRGEAATYIIIHQMRFVFFCVRRAKLWVFYTLFFFFKLLKRLSKAFRRG